MGLNSSNLPYSKESQLHRVRTKPKSKNFTEKVKAQIFERDDYKCVRCGTMNDLEHTPHHIFFKSQGGYGTLDNGATVCRGCHDWAHGKCEGPYGEPTYEGRKWFEDYRVKHYL